MSETERLFSRTIADLRRRRVFRVAAAYGVVAWLIIEVADIVLPALRVPEWVITAVVITALAGFPVALLLGWLFDVTSDGVVRTRPADTDAPAIRRVARRGIDFIIIGVLLAVIGYLVYQQDPFGADGGAERSIAVLPFEDFSPNGDNEYFSDGIAEELLNTLVGVEGLRVAARTSSFAFKNRNEDVRSIAQKLNVKNVLSGSVRRAGDRVRITATLIDAEDGFQLWSETYDRRLDNIFDIQAEISRSIVDQLRLELIGELPRMMASVDEQIDIRAYDLYLLGRHHWHKRTADSLERALDLFQQAIVIDENFALAYTGVADTYLLMEGYGGLTREQATARAEAPVARALALDSTLSEAYASQGLLRLNQGDPSAAELALRGAVDLNPNNSMAHMWLGLVLSRRIGPDAALNEYERALSLDPLHPVIHQNVATTRGDVGEFEEARAGLENLIANGPEYGRAYSQLARLAVEFGRYDEAVRWGRLAIEEGDTFGYVALAEAMLGLGDFESAQAYLATALERAGEQGGDWDVLGTQASLYLAQSKFGELEALAAENASDHDPNGQVWAGVARIGRGDGEGGAALLDEVLANSMMEWFEPDDRLALLTAAAWGESVEEHDADIRAYVERAMAVYEAALAAGWNTPQLHGWAAMALYIGDQREASLERLRVAVDLGWRESRLLGGVPVIDAFREDPEFRELMAWVDQDLERMERVVAASQLDSGGVSVAGR